MKSVDCSFGSSIQPVSQPAVIRNTHAVKERRGTDEMGQDHSKTGTAQTLSAEDIAKKYEKVEKIENDVQVLLEKGSNRLIALKEFSLTDDHEF